ncbi:hypothetical protein OHC33_009435 [Knufia fluminis]|uniref:Uncharacterized protein n=1 Tax=Knufia fluminis TaxID=191047 RepID=A0AAN8EEI4_9EURO|nr:hypothetical protein OHC33_009435 [Knufia fluminis]
MTIIIRLDIAVAVITLIFMHTLHYQIIYREASTIVIFACIMAYQAALIFTLNFTSPEIFASNAELGPFLDELEGHGDGEQPSATRPAGKSKHRTSTHNNLPESGFSTIDATVTSRLLLGSMKQANLLGLEKQNYRFIATNQGFGEWKLLDSDRETLARLYLLADRLCIRELRNVIVVEFRRLDEWEEIHYSEEHLYALDLLWEEGNRDALLIDTLTIELIDEPSRIRWAGLAPASSCRVVAYTNEQEHV